jgi:asparagine synthase (glutamine-hydrolysing)
MCGIAGIYHRDAPVDEKLLRRMTRALTHRGPDDEGYHCRSSIGLGVRRLSIIDLAGGHQPISNEDGRFTIVFNGEVYNYLELRDELMACGHRFATRTDTEVIVHLYEDLGAECLTRLNGMFAFAIWDEAKQELFVARDRLGVKPLYYWAEGGTLLFASELKALLLCPSISRKLDRQAVADYLTFMYIPAPKTPFQEIRKLLPGHYLWRGRSGFILRRYWSLADYATPQEVSKADAVARVRELLDDAVRIRLRSDVAVGAFLSGGVDSSSVVALASRHLDSPLATFSVGFTSGDRDELPYARQVATVHRTDHHEIRADPEHVIRLLPRLIWHMDEPSGDSAFVPTFLVSEMAAARVSVILSGLGGDELFAGYSRYRLPFARWSLRMRAYNLVPELVRRGIVLPLAARLSEKFHSRLVSATFRPAHEQYLDSVTIFSSADKVRLLGGNGWHHPDEAMKHYLAYPGEDPVNRLLYVDALTYLPDDILSLTDRMSMAASLEARTPFLDYRLVQFCAGLPGPFKLTSLAWKIVLKEAMVPLLPPPILDREKWGFGAPVASWLSGRLFPYLRALLPAGLLVSNGIVNPQAVEQLLRSFEAEPALGQQLWTLLVLELWARIFLEGAPPETAPAVSLDDLVAVGMR